MDEKIKNSLKILTWVYYTYQDERKKLDNKLGLTKDGSRKKKSVERDEGMLKELFRRKEELKNMETKLFNEIKKEVHNHKLWNDFLKDVKGCGETMAAVIIVEFDIYKAPAVSNLWSFAGLAPGKDKRIKGQKNTFNMFLKAKLCGVLGSSFLKTKSEYSEFYYNMKNRLESKDWGIANANPKDKNKPKAMHQHRAANRYMVKMFLKDLYVKWRELEGLEIRKPYAEEYLGKVHE